jgi:CheY-like chemotaxis protein
MLNSVVHILLADDDDIEVETIIRSFQQEKIVNPYTRVHNGLEALQALQGQGRYVRFPHRYVILLDIDMPRMNGIEFLQALAQYPSLQKTIVFVMINSAVNAAYDKKHLAAYQDHITGYITKSEAGMDFLAISQRLDAYRVIVQPHD